MTSENISFDDNGFKYKSRSILGESQSPKMIQMLVRRGFAKNEKQAANFMVVLAILLFAAAGFVMWYSLREPSVIDKTDTIILPNHTQ